MRYNKSYRSEQELNYFQFYFNFEKFLSSLQFQSNGFSRLETEQRKRRKYIADNEIT